MFNDLRLLRLTQRKSQNLVAKQAGLSQPLVSLVERDLIVDPEKVKDYRQRILRVLGFGDDPQS